MTEITHTDHTTATEDAGGALTLAQVQAIIDAWIGQWEEGYFSPLSNLARLTEEVGELSREINHHYGDKPKKASEAPGSVAEELGDIVFITATIANSLGVDLTEAFQQTMRKYNIRDADRWTRRADADHEIAQAAPGDADA